MQPTHAMRRVKPFSGWRSAALCDSCVNLTVRQGQGEDLTGAQCGGIPHDLTVRKPGNGVAARQGVFGAERA